MPCCQMNAEMLWTSSVLQPELRHLRGRTEVVRVRQPVRNPFLVNLHADFFQVRTDFLDFLQQVVAAAVRAVSASASIRLTVNRQIRGLRVELFAASLSGAWSPSLLQARNFQLVVGFLVRELQNLLACADEQFVLIVEALEAVAADAALLAIELFAFVQRVGMLGDHVGRVALLAARVEIRRIVERPEPVLVAAVASRRRSRARVHCRRGTASNRTFRAGESAAGRDRDGW